MVALTKSLNELITTIYGTVVDTDQWPDVLSRTAWLAGAESTTVCLVDYVAEELNSQFMCPLTEKMYPHYIQSPHMEVEIKALGRLPQVQTSSGFTSTSEFVQNANAQFPDDPIDITAAEQWLESEWGIGERYLCRLNIQPSFMDLHTLLFRADTKNDVREGLQKTELLTPHFAKAVEISRPFLLLKARFQATLEVLDRFHLGVFIITPSGKVALRNTAANRILEQKDAVSVGSSGKLNSDKNSHPEGLDKLIDETLANQSKGVIRHSTEVLLQRRSGNAPYLVEISPLAEPTVIGPHSGLMVIMIDPEHKKIVRTNGMSQMFGLSNAEDAVCGLLIEGYSTSEIAEARNVSPVTVKNQVQSLLAKTGNRNRSDLIRQALSINLPIDSNGHDNHA
ncbi:MAG: LuxR C-terminal-related transcriptional regulator [Granulosicoccus sp.]|nr:LuxR C-terminal-related transcriptional regulator [Granulosicoccus sp.]